MRHRVTDTIDVLERHYITITAFIRTLLNYHDAASHMIY